MAQKASMNPISFLYYFFARSYAGHIAQGESDRAAAYSASLFTTLPAMMTCAALLKGIISIFGWQEPTRSIAIGLGLDNGEMSLIFLTASVFALLLAYSLYGNRSRIALRSLETGPLSFLKFGLAYMGCNMTMLLLSLFAENSALPAVVVSLVFANLVASRRVSSQAPVEPA